MLDRSIVVVEASGGRVDTDGLRARLACRVWSYGGLPDAVPPPVTVDLLVDPEAGGAGAGAAIVAGRPRVQAIVGPYLGVGALAEAVWPGFGELLGLYGATGHPLHGATREPDEDP